jgi:hypothetical protein
MTWKAFKPRSPHRLALDDIKKLAETRLVEIAHQHKLSYFQQGWEGGSTSRLELELVPDGQKVTLLVHRRGDFSNAEREEKSRDQARSFCALLHQGIKAVMSEKAGTEKICQFGDSNAETFTISINSPLLLRKAIRALYKRDKQQVMEGFDPMPVPRRAAQPSIRQ